MFCYIHIYSQDIHLCCGLDLPLVMVFCYIEEELVMCLQLDMLYREARAEMESNRLLYLASLIGDQGKSCLFYLLKQVIVMDFANEGSDIGEV